MEFNWLFYILSLLAAGAASGFVAGLLGVGGGIVRIPIFLFLLPIFGVHSSILMHVAAGTSLALSIPSAVMASHAQYKAGNLDLNFLKVWAPALVVGVIIGTFVMRYVSSRFLEQVFVVIVLIFAVQMFFTTSKFKITKELPGKITRGIIGVIIGTLSKMTGLSGGSYTTVSLTAVGYPIHRTVAIGSAGGFFISIVGAAGAIVNGIGIAGRPEFSWGYLDLTAILVMVIPIIILAPQGVRLANHLSQERLRKVFAIFLFVVGIDMIRSLYF